jgi:hypothetical protein
LEEATLQSTGNWYQQGKIPRYHRMNRPDMDGMILVCRKKADEEERILYNI